MEKLHRFKISYTDCGEYHVTSFKAWDEDDAEEQFWDWIENDFGGDKGIILKRVWIAGQMGEGNLNTYLKD